MSDNIHHSFIAENVCCLTFDQIDSSANVFNLTTLAELDDYITSLAKDSLLRGVIFTSAKPKVFHAGADVHALQTFDDAALRTFLERGQSLFSRIAALPVPTVAAIHGACLGGGYELALACKYRIASDDRATKIGLPETKLGIIPAWGGSTRLPRLIGVTRTLDVILTGKTPAAKQALKLGMIDALAPREFLVEAALRVIKKGIPRRRSPLFNALIGRIVAPQIRKNVAQRTRGHYPALRKAIDVISTAASGLETDSLARERLAELELAHTPACRHLMRLFSLQERARKPITGEVKPIRRVLVIGAGVMGAAIAQWLAARRVSVVLRDVDPPRVAAGIERIRKLFDDRRVFSAKEARDALDRITPVTNDVPLGPFDLVIEAAVEKMDLKKQIFAKLGGTCILATNTSALSIAEIARATNDPGRVVGLHFFNPVHKMQLVEVIAAPQTNPDIVQRVVRFAQQISKLPIIVRDSPGFVVNRILLPYLAEAGRLFEHGARVTEIDEAMLDFGMPMGPLRLIDEIGVDVAADVAVTLGEVPAVLDKLRGAGWLGRKSGSGFYNYRGRQPTVNAAADQFRRDSTAAGLNRLELQRRMVRLMVIEAERCEQETIAAADDIDFAMVMGAGFAPFRGGPLQLRGEFQ